MGRILIVDNETKSVDEIKKALTALDSQNEIESYSSFAEFDKSVSQKNPDEIKFNLLLLEYSLLKHNDWEAKLSDLRTKNKVENAPIIFLSYEHATLNHKTTGKFKILNIFYKPFDPLILKESLNLALKHGENVKPIEMKPQSSSTLVAIMKEIDLLSLSEVGFATKNNSAVALNSFSKYYGPLFTNGKKQSVWAQCVSSKPIPDEPETYINQFHFIGLEQIVLLKLRKYIQEKKQNKEKKYDWKIETGVLGKEIKIAILDLQENLNTHFKEDIETHFKNASVDILVFDPAKKNEKYETHYDLIINTSHLLKQDLYKPCFSDESLHMLLTDHAVSDDEFREWLLIYRDIFKHPIDRRLFYKKLKLILPDLVFMEDPEHLTISTQEKIKAASLIKVSEICELYLNFSYHRELSLGEFREFAFIAEDENQIVQMPAFCNSADKGASEPGQGASFMHQFVFWGTTDYYMKQIRIWLLQNYIAQNQEN